MIQVHQKVERLRQITEESNRRDKGFLERNIAEDAMIMGRGGGSSSLSKSMMK